MLSDTRKSLRRRDLLRYGVSTLAAGTVLSGCSIGSASPRGETKVIRYQGWSGQVLLPELAADLGLLGDVRLEWIGNTTSGPQDIQATVTGDIDIGGAFNGAIIRLAAAGAPIKAVIAYYGANDLTNTGYYVPQGSPIRSPRDFIGKSVGMNTIGAHAQDVLSVYLQRGGLTEEEIRQVQPVVVPPISADQALRSGQIDVSAMSNPISDKAMAHGGIHPVFRDYDLLGAFSAGCYVLRDEFIAANPNTTRALVGGVARAIRWTQTRPYSEVVARFLDILRRRNRNEDSSTIKYWKSAGIAGPGGVISDREFTTWLDRLIAEGVVAPHSINVGSLYTNEFNPYRTA